MAYIKIFTHIFVELSVTAFLRFLKSLQHFCLMDLKDFLLPLEVMLHIVLIVVHLSLFTI